MIYIILILIMLNNKRISQTSFVGRQAELQALDELWASSRAELIILYGRRRVGKTRLLTHWLKTRKPRAIFWVAEPTSSLDQLRYFSQTIYNFENPTSSAPDWRVPGARLRRSRRPWRTPLPAKWPPCEAATAR